MCGHGSSIPKPSPSHTCSAEQQGGTGLSGVLVLSEPSLVESFHKVSLTGLLSRGLQMGQNISTACFANTSYVKCSFFTRNICAVYMYHLTGNSCYCRIGATYHVTVLKLPSKADKAFSDFVTPPPPTKKGCIRKFL